MKIISDGTVAGTHFLLESGEKIHGVIGFSMNVCGSDDSIVAQLTVRVTEIDMRLDDDSVEVVELKILEDWEDIDD